MNYSEKFGVLCLPGKIIQYWPTKAVSASFIELRATWTKCWFPDRDGNTWQMWSWAMTILRLSGNASVWRYRRNANRIETQWSPLTEKDYKLELNNGPNNLHSGPDLYHNLRLWEKAERSRQRGSRLDFFLNSRQTEIRDTHQMQRSRMLIHCNKGQLLKTGTTWLQMQTGS